MYYCSHMKFENEIVLNIHCYTVEIEHGKLKHKMDSGEEVERGLKHREGNHDEDLTCRPRAEMNAPPPEQLPPIPTPSHPPPPNRVLAVHSPSSHVRACRSEFLPLRCVACKVRAFSLQLHAHFSSSSTVHCSRESESRELGESKGGER